MLNLFYFADDSSDDEEEEDDEEEIQESKIPEPPKKRGPGRPPKPGRTATITLNKIANKTILLTI